MMLRRVRIQLWLFVVVACVAMGYGGFRFFDAGSLLSPPYEIEARFDHSGGIYKQAEVEMLGTRIGSVTQVRPGPSGSSRVIMAIDSGVKLPRSVKASIEMKSAIGEQVVELTPTKSGGPNLKAGSVIGLNATTSSVRVEDLLENIDQLLASVPVNDVATLLDEGALAFAGTGPDLRRLVVNADAVSSETLERVNEITTLIRTGRTVLETQSNLGPVIRQGLAETGALLRRLKPLANTLAASFTDGVRAGAEVTSLLVAVQDVLPALFGDLNAITRVAVQRLDAIRKTLVLFPYALETGGQALRRCDEYDPRTGKAVESTCHYDDQGRPVYRAYFAVQLQEAPGSPPYLPCTQGYEGTRKFLPDGTALDGGTPYSEADEPNMQAGCTSSPTDPIEPNVRGPQNVR